MSLLSTKEQEIIILQENFLEEQEVFLEKLEQINPIIADILINEALQIILKNIFDEDNLSSINLKYLQGKRLFLKQKRLDKEQEARRLKREQEARRKKEEEARKEKLQKEQDEKLKIQNKYQNKLTHNSYQSSQNYSNSSWSWGNDNKEIHVKGHYKKNGTYVKPHTRKKHK